MLGYQVEYELSGLVSWAFLYAYSSSGARATVEIENDGCRVLTILPWVPRGRRS